MDLKRKSAPPGSPIKFKFNIKMKKIQFSNSRFQIQRGVQLEDGRIIVVIDANRKFLLRYEDPFDLSTGVIYEPSNAPKDAMTLNKIIRENLGHDVFCYDEVSLKLGWIRTMNEKRIRKIQSYFTKNGISITKEAILHNYNAWRLDLKSGYRDESNGYHLFSPCGCNPFILRVTNLVEICSDWQITYSC